MPQGVVPSLWWAQVVLGGRQPGSALPITAVIVYGSCGPEKTPFLSGPSSSHLQIRTLAQMTPRPWAAWTFDSLRISALVPPS